MDLKLDKQTIAITESDTATLREVIERISDEIKGQNRVISEIFVNGEAMGGWDDPQFSSMTVSQCSTMELLSDEPKTLAHKVLYEIAGYMPKIKDALVETSSRIQSRKEEEGLQLLQQIMTTWAELFQGFQSATIVTGLDLSTIVIQGQSFTELNQSVHKLLDDASEMISEQRYLELSDILEYELAPKMPLIEEAIYQLVKELEKKPN